VIRIEVDRVGLRLCGDHNSDTYRYLFTDSKRRNLLIPRPYLGDDRLVEREIICDQCNLLDPGTSLSFGGLYFLLMARSDAFCSTPMSHPAHHQLEYQKRDRHHDHGVFQS
jgi:hypothetical protein